MKKGRMLQLHPPHQQQRFMLLSVLLAFTLFSLLAQSRSENSHFYEFYDDGETTWALPSSSTSPSSPSTSSSSSSPASPSSSSPAFLPLYTSSASSLLTSPAEIVERSISVEFAPRRRRFPFLKALVHHIVSPERRDLSLDVSGNTAAILIERTPRKKKLADLKEAIANSAVSSATSVAASAAAVAAVASSAASSSTSSVVSGSSSSSPSTSASSASSVSPASVTISRSPLEAIALEVLSDSSEDNNHLEVDFVPISPTVSAHITTTTTSSSSNNNGRPARKRGLFLINVLSRIVRSINVTAVSEEMRTGRTSSRASCIACHAIAALYLSPLYSKDAMVAAARSVCISFRLQTPRVCRGLVDSFKDDLDYIRRNTKLNRQEMCGVVFGMDCARTISPYLNWTIAIPPDTRPGSNARRRFKRNNKYSPLTPHHQLTSASLSGSQLHHSPSVHHSNGDGHVGNLYDYTSDAGSIPLSGAVYSAVQITDVHIDPYYEVGTSADCGEPLCCRSGSPYRPASHTKIPVTSSVSNLPSSSSTSNSPSVASSASLHQSSLPSSSHTASVWGDYRNCDTPVASLKSALEHISQTHPHASYWMWTGDISPHDIWNITREEVIFQVRLVTEMIKQHAKVPVFPVIGNHEGVPVNSFPPPEIRGELSISWLYDELAKQWSYWLPEDALETLRYGGYYRVKVRPGFRVICLNMNYCTRLNPWSLYDPVDPGKQLEWLTKELVDAENDGDHVHLIGHIPPDNKECTQAWLYNFLRIVDRFQDTILAQYYGHTHRDEFRVLLSPHYHNSKKSRPISVAYIGPSITAFTENNPGYRVYFTDPSGYVKDHETYFFNLTEANASFEPVWRKEYNAFDFFNLTNLGPSGWHRFVSRMMDDDTLFQSYYKFSEVKKHESCYGECKKTILNDLVVGHPLKTRPKSLFGHRKHN